MLLTALRFLPALEELTLELPRPSALGRGFFTALLARPATIPYGREQFKLFEWAQKQNDWHVAISPSLKVFKLRYLRWLRPSEQNGMIPPLLVLGWTRQKIAVKLQVLCVYMGANSRDQKIVELVPGNSQCLTNLVIPHLTHVQPSKSNDTGLASLFEMCLTSAALSAIEVLYGWYGPIFQHTQPLFGPSFHSLRLFRVCGDPSRKFTITVLHHFQHLEELSLTRVWVSLFRNDVELPLVKTLRQLSIDGGCLKWLDGLKFVQLTSFRVGPPGEYHNSFSNRVDMPACTYFNLLGGAPQFLAILQAHFVLPFLEKW